MRGAEWLGRIVGVLLGPIVFLIALVRGARAFHPDGVIHRADVVPIAPDGDPELARAAARLAGPALVRFSAALRARGDERPDVLGAGIRFGAAGDQDLLLGTFDGFGLRTLRRALATTDARDYLHNVYRAVARYTLDGVGEVTLFARGEGGETAGQGREERLARAASAGRARLRLEVARPPSRETLPLVEIRIVERSSVPNEALRLDPRHAGRGLHPIGFLTGIRWAAYPASQLGRGLRERARLRTEARAQVVQSSRDEC